MGYSVVLAQNDTIRLNDQVLSTLANEDCGKVTFPNELAKVAVDKQGNGLLTINNEGLICDLEARLVMAQADDQYLNSLLAQQMPPNLAPTIISGVVTKNFADQAGNITSVQLTLSGGVIVKGIDMIIAANGNTEQVIAPWRLRFASWSRQIL